MKVNQDSGSGGKVPVKLDTPGTPANIPTQTPTQLDNPGTPADIPTQDKKKLDDVGGYYTGSMSSSNTGNIFVQHAQANIFTPATSSRSLLIQNRNDSRPLISDTVRRFSPVARAEAASVGSGYKMPDSSYYTKREEERQINQYGVGSETKKIGSKWYAKDDLGRWVGAYSLDPVTDQNTIDALEYVNTGVGSTVTPGSSLGPTVGGGVTSLRDTRLTDKSVPVVSGEVIPGATLSYYTYQSGELRPELKGRYGALGETFGKTGLVANVNPDTPSYVLPANSDAFVESQPGRFVPYRNEYGAFSGQGEYDLYEKKIALWYGKPGTTGTAGSIGNIYWGPKYQSHGSSLPTELPADRIVTVQETAVDTINQSRELVAGGVGLIASKQPINNTVTFTDIASIGYERASKGDLVGMVKAPWMYSFNKATESFKSGGSVDTPLGKFGTSPWVYQSDQAMGLVSGKAEAVDLTGGVFGTGKGGRLYYEQPKMGELHVDPLTSSFYHGTNMINSGIGKTADYLEAKGGYNPLVSVGVGAGEWVASIPTTLIQIPVAGSMLWQGVAQNPGKTAGMVAGTGTEMVVGLIPFTGGNFSLRKATSTGLTLLTLRSGVKHGMNKMVGVEPKPGLVSATSSRIYAGAKDAALEWRYGVDKYGYIKPPAGGIRGILQPVHPLMRELYQGKGPVSDVVGIPVGEGLRSGLLEADFYTRGGQPYTGKGGNILGRVSPSTKYFNSGYSGSWTTRLVKERVIPDRMVDYTTTEGYKNGMTKIQERVNVMKSSGYSDVAIKKFEFERTQKLMDSLGAHERYRSYKQSTYEGGPVYTVKPGVDVEGILSKQRVRDARSAFVNDVMSGRSFFADDRGMLLPGRYAPTPTPTRRTGSRLMEPKTSSREVRTQSEIDYELDMHNRRIRAAEPDVRMPDIAAGRKFRPIFSVPFRTDTIVDVSLRNKQGRPSVVDIINTKQKLRVASISDDSTDFKNKQRRRSDNVLSLITGQGQVQAQAQGQQQRQKQDIIAIVMPRFKTPVPTVETFVQIPKPPKSTPKRTTQYGGGSTGYRRGGGRYNRRVEWENRWGTPFRVGGGDARIPLPLGRGDMDIDIGVGDIIGNIGSDMLIGPNRRPAKPNSNGIGSGSGRKPKASKGGKPVRSPKRTWGYI